MGYDYYIDGPIHQSDLLRPHVRIDEPLPVQFFRSAVYAGVQEPLSGFVQLTDKLVGSNLLPKVQFIDPCEKAKFGTVDWHTQQFGAMIGVSAGLLALHKGVGGASNMLAGRIEDRVENQAALALRTITDAAATGFIHNGVFRPVAPEEGNFYAARLKNGFVGAGTFATLSASSLGIKYLGEGREGALGAVLRSNVGSTVLSGIPGGIAYAEMKSLADGKGAASAKTIGQAVYSFSVLGGAFALGKDLIGTTPAEESLLQQLRARSAAPENQTASPAKAAPAQEQAGTVKPGAVAEQPPAAPLKAGLPAEQATAAPGKAAAAGDPAGPAAGRALIVADKAAPNPAKPFAVQEQELAAASKPFAVTEHLLPGTKNPSLTEQPAAR